MTITDLSSLSQVNYKFNDYVDSDKVWDYHYNKTWRKIYEEKNLQNPNDVTSKEKCIKAFDFSRKQFF